MKDNYLAVTLSPMEVWCVTTINGVRDSKIAFEYLEKTIGNLRGRKFYGVLEGNTDKGIYKACVVKKPNDEFRVLEEWVIPGGKYLKAKMINWSNCTNKIGKTFSNMARKQKVDTTRPSIEFYRSQKVLVLYLPII